MKVLIVFAVCTLLANTYVATLDVYDDPVYGLVISSSNSITLYYAFPLLLYAYFYTCELAIVSWPAVNCIKNTCPKLEKIERANST
ncbi:hypothetical protein TSAR_014288 [Trichomalopsis sarcophagae]|uniref:Uncharacterized protein n=1 Tax=Trichomalopsis sarcophagae TaxID=543379 RepID=A0A232F8Y3_9HYME|nr:hypothetical protein TSAR_014288 [Trichomalopsis sarcophagae]